MKTVDAFDAVGRYRKLIAAVVGIVILVVYRWSGIDLGPYEFLCTDAVIGALTAFGVWAAKNDRMPSSDQ